MIAALAARYWQLLVGIGVGLLLLIALLATRATLADTKKDLRLEKQAHQATVAGYRAAAEARKVSDLLNVERVDGEAESISKETIHDYQDRIAALRADFAERVRRATQGNSGSPSGADLPGVSNASLGADEGTCKAQLPAQDALIASEQAEQLIALQAWIAKVVSINVNGKQP